MKTLLQLCTAVEHALDACCAAADARPDILETATNNLAEAQYLLGARHREIADMCRDAYSPKTALRNALRPRVPPDGMLLFRGEKRWMRDRGSDDAQVLQNSHAGMSSEQLAEEFIYEILADYRHVIIVRPR
jgi:hypothetical protein